LNDRQYQGIGRIKENFFGRNECYRLALGVGVPKVKQISSTYLTTQVTDKDCRKYKRMFDHFFKTYIANVIPTKSVPLTRDVGGVKRD